MEDVLANTDQTRLERLRWQTILTIFCAGALAMLSQLLLDSRNARPAYSPIILTAFIGFILLALWQALLRRPHARVEQLGLGLALSVFLLNFVRRVGEVFLADGQGDTLVEIITWSGVIYAASFIIFPIRQALVLTGCVLVFMSSYWAYFVFRIGMPGQPQFGVNALSDIMMSGIITILLLSILKRFTDVLARTQARASALSELAHVDSLTGLYNRRYLDQMLKDAFNRAQRYDHPLSVAMCDIDFFKSINDTLSHAVGDETLKALANVLEQLTRETDIVSRYGGEEFVIVFLETPKEQAVAVCEKLRRVIEGNDWSSIHPHLQVTVSFGVTDDTGVASHEKMLSEADRLLYQAKHRGKNQVQA